MNKPIAIGIGVFLLVLLLLFSTTFTVKYNEVAVVQRFGETSEKSVVTDPGLHYRMPVFIDKVIKLDTRLQVVESPLEQITTKDGFEVVVRAYLLWKVDENGRGPLDFFNTYSSIDGATQSLRGQFRTAFTGTLSEYAFTDLIGSDSRLAAAETDISNAMTATLAGRGIEALAVGMSQVVLPARTSKAVLQRMEVTRVALAQGERDIGNAEAERIRSQGNTRADKITTFANLRAEEIRAAGQREGKKYLEQMGEDEDLAIFLVWLDTLERTLFRNTTVILPTSGFAPFHLLNPTDVAYRGAIPHPIGGNADIWTAQEESLLRKAAAAAVDNRITRDLDMDKLDAVDVSDDETRAPDDEGSE